MYELKMQVLWIFALIGAACAYHDNHVRKPQSNAALKTEYEWKYLDYVWKSPGQRDKYIRRGLYNPRNMVPVDIDRAMGNDYIGDGRTFLTVIRRTGVPASLHLVSSYRGEDDLGPLLHPYPDWSWYEASKGCKGIISVHRIAIDKCNRLWALDTGKIDDKFVCPAKLLAIDLFTDDVIFSKTIPDDVARNSKGEGLLVTPLVVSEDCVYTTVYMADVEGKGLVIWNGARFFRLEADVYEAEERNADFDIAGDRFHRADGVLGMALTPDHNMLYFRPFASRSLYAANTKDLQNGDNGFVVQYKRGWDLLPSQASAMVFWKGTLFYGLTHEIALGCWHKTAPWKREFFYIAAQDDVRLQFTSGMKVVKNPLDPDEEQLFVMTNRMQKIYADTINLGDINFRVLKADVMELISGTICDLDRVKNESLGSMK